uniref:Pre-phenomycin n=1 Tax=Streptomyces roseoverticillatus TaxID=66429 RepID=UPI00135F186E|nr:Chain A, Pre-phenomycin [Streptomyces roseoverticillatus]
GAMANPKTIKAAAYNQARSTLADAGSRTAAKSHPIHGKTDVPVSYGTSLLAAARDEFRQADKKLPAKDKKSDMSIAHYNAVHSAAKTMGIDTW